MLSLRGNWIRKKNFALYSEVEAGYLVPFSTVAWNLKPVGIRAGDRVFFHASLGAGWKLFGSPLSIFGLEAGIGFRF